MIGLIAASTIWKTIACGSPTQPSPRGALRPIAERCFHRHCSVPNAQRKRCYEFGCNVYITKPVNYENFANAIRQLGLFFSVIQVPPAAP